MTERKAEKERTEELTEEEVEKADGEPLPDREVMSWIRPLPVPGVQEPPIDWE